MTYKIALSILSIIGFNLIIYGDDNLKASLIEKDRITVARAPYMATNIADEWHNRGNDDFAAEFDKIAIEKSPYKIFEIVDKWNKRGKKDIAKDIATKFGYYNMETSTIEEDRIEVVEKPHKITAIANKWHDLGHDDFVLEFDEILAAQASFEAPAIANKWYDWGKKDIALKFDKILLTKYPTSGASIAEKWFKRGEMDIAVELGLEYDPLFVYEDWQKRGEEALFLQLLPAYDIETSSLSRDKFEVRNLRPDIDIINKIDKIADKWYQKGDNSSASYFDKIYLSYHPKLLDNVVRKWTDRGEEGIASNIKNFRSNPVQETRLLDALIRGGYFDKAEQYGNELLEYWISQSDENIREFIDLKLKTAIKIKSKYYYDILQSKLIDKNKDDIIQNYGKYLENIPLSPENRDLSVTDYLTHRAYVNPEFLSTYNLSIEKARMMLEVDIYELIKGSDITFSILHVVALHAKGDPRYKLQIFYESPFNNPAERGAYLPQEGEVFTATSPLRSPDIRKTLAHEWTHQAMDIIFHNERLPYAKNDKTAEIEWNKAMNTVLDKLSGISSFVFVQEARTPYERARKSFKMIYQYNSNEYGQEAIARFAELIGSGDYDDPEVKEFLKPIYDYWIQYIQPTIEKYVKDHAAIDNFVSDWERENILDPFYRDQIEEKKKKVSISKDLKDRIHAEVDEEYKGDLEMAASNDLTALQSVKKWMDRGNMARAAEIFIIGAGPADAAEMAKNLREQFTVLEDDETEYSESKKKQLEFAEEIERQLKK